MTRPLIVGGGPAGSAAAIHLARAGSPALLVERARETGDAICGGFLSWRTLEALDRLGLDADALGGQRVARVRLFAGPRRAEARLPRPGMGLSRRRLDSLLLDTAARLGTGIERGVAVRRVAERAATLADGTTLCGASVFLGTGKHNLVGHPRPAPSRVAADPVVGLRLRIASSRRGAALVGDAVELFLFDRGYAGLVAQEDGSINLCLAVHKSRLAEAGGRPKGLIAAWGEENGALGERLTSGDRVGAIDAIASVPYGWRAGASSDDVWRLGDQAGVIPSLAGEGMGIALASAASGVASWRRGAAAGDWQRAFERRLTRPMHVADALWRLAEAPRWNGAGVAMLAHAPWAMALLARATRVAA